MTEPTTYPTTTRQPLRRLKSDRVLGGVCSGLARYLGVDPVLVRVIVAVLALFAGGGILIYLAAWLLIPEEGRDQSAGQQLVGNNNTSTALIIVVAVVIALMLAIPGGGWLGIGPHFGAPSVILLVAAGFLVYWLVRRDDSGHGSADLPTTPVPTTQPPTTGRPVDSGASMTTQVIPPVTPGQPPSGTPGPPPVPPSGQASEWAAPPPPDPPQPKQPRSVLGLLTVSAMAVVTGILVMVNLAVPDASINATTIFASALATVGVGLLVGTRYGRSRGLIALGVVLAIATSIAAAVPNVDIRGGVGDRTWEPTTAAELQDEFRLGLGEGTLDLRSLQLPPTGFDETITASVGVGELKVLVPGDYDVNVTSEVNLGQINIEGRQVDGGGQSLVEFLDVPDERGELNLDLDVGLGEITVEQSPLPSSIPFRNGDQS